MQVPGGTYSLILVPAGRIIPETTLAQLVALAEGGATVAFEKALPPDVPGSRGKLEPRRAEMRALWRE